jgi:hypothetical protein
MPALLLAILNRDGVPQCIVSKWIGHSITVTGRH